MCAFVCDWLELLNYTKFMVCNSEKRLMNFDHQLKRVLKTVIIYCARLSNRIKRNSQNFQNKSHTLIITWFFH